MQIDLETILALVITAITLNLIFIGWYIMTVLKEIRKTIQKAGKMIDDVDQSVQDGVGKMVAMEKPLQAIATTSVALAGVLKGSGIVQRATDSILAASRNINSNGTSTEEKPSKTKRPKLFRKGK